MALAYGAFAKGKELAVRSLRIDAAEEILPLRTDKLPPRRASALLYVQPHPAMKSAIWRSASVLRKPVAQRAGTAMTRLFASREHAQYGGAPIVRKNTNQHVELRDSFKCVVVSAPTWRGDFGVAAVTESGKIVFYEHNFDRKQKEIYVNKGDHLSPASGTNCLAVFASDPENAYFVAYELRCPKEPKLIIKKIPYHAQSPVDEPSWENPFDTRNGYKQRSIARIRFSLAGTLLVAMTDAGELAV